MIQVWCGAFNSIKVRLPFGTAFLRISNCVAPPHVLKRIGAKHFGLMSH